MKRSLLIAMVMLAIFASLATQARAATIMLRKEADLVSDVVRLGDVAEITGSEELELLEQLRSLPICSAPSPAEHQILSAGTVAIALRSAGADLSRMSFAGAPHVVVRRRHELVTVDELRSAFAGHVSERTGWAEDSFWARAPKNFDPIVAPVGDRRVVVETFPNEDFCGSVLTHFRILVDGNLYSELAHRFVVERYIEALVTVRKVARHQFITPSDVEIQKVRQSRISQDTLTGMDQIEDLMASRTIPTGRLLTDDFLIRPPVIKKGETASVILQGDGFCITTEGRVLENGSTGELVRVRLASRRIVQARVLDSRTLRMARKGTQNGKFPEKDLAIRAQGQKKGGNTEKEYSQAVVSRDSMQGEDVGSVSGS